MEVTEKECSDMVIVLYGNEGCIPEPLFIYPNEVEKVINRFKETGEIEIRQLNRDSFENKKAEAMYIAKDITLIIRRSQTDETL